jgi:hypothetical protein
MRGGERFTESAPEEHFVNHCGGVSWQPGGGCRELDA